METLDIFLLSLPVGLLITWRLLTGSKKQHGKERRASESAQGGERFARRRNVGLVHSRYVSKRLRICNRPCRAALEIRDHAYLSVEAPLMPLPECDRKDVCRCEMVSGSDRRSGHDRRYPAEDIIASDSLVLPDSAILTKDRRADRDRRKRRTVKPVV